jgi:hypothetical protein
LYNPGLAGRYYILFPAASFWYDRDAIATGMCLACGDELSFGSHVHWKLRSGIVSTAASCRKLTAIYIYYIGVCAAYSRERVLSSLYIPSLYPSGKVLRGVTLPLKVWIGGGGQVFSTVALAPLAELLHLEILFP